MELMYVVLGRRRCLRIDGPFRELIPEAFGSMPSHGDGQSCWDGVGTASEGSVGVGIR